MVWLDLASAVATRAEAWAEGAGLACTAHWEGTLAADVTARVDIAVRPPAEAAAGTILPFEAVVRAADGVEVRQTGELVVAEPGWVMYMVPHFHYDPVWWNTQAGHLSGWDELLCARFTEDATSTPAWCSSRPTSSGPASTRPTSSYFPKWTT